MSRIALTIALASIVLLLTFRMSVGVDLSDEAYYIAFADGWLKTGIAEGEALGIHQTAAMLTYPFVRIFDMLRGGVDGLAMFLRYIYLASSMVAAIFFSCLIREIRGRSVSVLSGALVLCFVPFSLPSPSYNTIGMHAMVAALSSCGVHFLRSASLAGAARMGGWALASAGAWTIAVLAYPTLFAVQCALLLCLLCVPPNGKQRMVWRYLLICAAMQVVGACALLGIFGLDRLRAMLNFSNASLQVSSGLGAKLKLLAAPMLQRSPFLALCASSATLGLASIWLQRSAAGCLGLAVLVIVMLVTSGVLGPTLFAQSHDIVFLLAIFAAVRWLCTWRSNSPRNVGLGALVVAGLVGGIVTSVTATNGLINFAVGGFFLAALGLALALPSRDAWSNSAHVTVLTCVSGLFLWNAFAFVYGEGTHPLKADLQRIQTGVFAGLLTRAPNAEAIAGTSRLLEAIAPPAKSLAVIGRLPGIYLLTTMKPMTLSTWDFSQHGEELPATEALRSGFYAIAAHQPDVLLQVTDPWTRPPSPASRQLMARYVLCRTARFEQWTVELYIKQTAVQAWDACTLS